MYISFGDVFYIFYFAFSFIYHNGLTVGMLAFVYSRDNTVQYFDRQLNAQ